MGPPWDLGSLKHHPPQSTHASTTNSVTPPLYCTETNTRGPGGSYIVIDLHTRTHTPHTHTEKHHPEPRACAHDGPHPQLHFPAPARFFGKHTLRSSSQRTQKHSSARPRGAPSNRNDLRTQITSPKPFFLAHPCKVREPGSLRYALFRGRSLLKARVLA